MINDVLALIRKCHCVKQTDLAKELGISTSYLSEIENGKKSFTLELLGKYANRFGIPISTFFILNEALFDKTSFTQKQRASRMIDSIKFIVK